MSSILQQHKASMCSQSVTEDLKTSICMNNYGIVMLEKQLYHEACVCFHMSLEGIKNIVTFLDTPAIAATTTTTKSRQYNDNYDIRIMMDGARKLCSDDVCQHSVQDNNIMIHRINCVHTFHQQVSYCPVLSSGSNVVYPVWIDDLTYLEVHNDPWMAFAVIAYNFAMAKRCNVLSKQYQYQQHTSGPTNENPEIQKEISDQVRLLLLADRLLSNRLSNGRMIEKIFLVYVSGIVLATLLHTTSCTDNLYKVSDCSVMKYDVEALPAKLCKLLSFITNITRTYPFGFVSDRPACAA
jgi:hypothetical protein